MNLNTLYAGDCIDVMRSWDSNVIDTIITDPPYGIRFMGKAWDGTDIEKMVEAKMRKDTVRPDGFKRHDGRAFAAGTYDQSLTANQAFQTWCCAWATEALRIAKPGAMMLVSGGTRTFHRMTAGLEDAGWEIRDCMMWLYGSGFPKSHNLHGEFEGWGTALKPAWEPIIVAMKPLDGTFAHNAEKHGVAGLNIDGSRIEGVKRSPCFKEPTSNGQFGSSDNTNLVDWDSSKGRWPANLILDEDSAMLLDMQTGELGLSKGGSRGAGGQNGRYSELGAQPYVKPGFGDSGGASRFFYCAKASKSERNAGCEELEAKRGGYRPNDDSAENSLVTRLHGSREAKNHHPTVKPLKLMEYLCTLTKTPTGGIVLDPFAGSGTTLLAAKNIGRPWIGIEMNSEYIAIAEARIKNDGPQLKMAI